MTSPATRSIVLRGIEAVPVELTWTAGRHPLVLAGIENEDSAREGAVRLRAAITNTIGETPRGTVLVSPGQPVWTSGLDLPAALAVYGCEDPAFGELGLSSAVRQIPGQWIAGRALPGAIVPDVGPHAPGARVAHTLAEALGDGEPAPPLPPAPLPHQAPTLADVPALNDVVHAILAAWDAGRPAMLIGPPGAGKILAVRIAHGMLPALEGVRADRVRALRDVAGMLSGGDVAGPLAPPFRAPHHTAPEAAVVGGGAGVPRPGEASLAHGGVLYLDELPEFSRSVRGWLRQPYESGEVTIGCRGGSVRFPARFRLVAGANPCPCGWHGQRPGVGPLGGCQCSDAAIARYRARWTLPGVPWVEIPVPARRPAEVTR